MLKLPIGISDFEEVRRDGYYYVDKSLFIQEALEGSKVQVITRPRRFGKTINLSMFHCFLTSSPETRRELFQGLAIAQARPFVQQQLSRLLAGEHLVTGLLTHTAFKNLTNDEQALWGLLVFSGYLTVIEKKGTPQHPQYELAIPNQEVTSLFYDVFQKWFRIQFRDNRLERLSNAVIEGEFETIQTLLSDLSQTILSYYDTGGEEPERVYHLFVLGMLVSMTRRYEMRSNRESGLGRYDIMLRPRDPHDPGVVIEFKTFSGDQPKSVLERALKQISSRGYATELRDAGVLRYHELAIACNGKRVYVAGLTRNADDGEPGEA